MPDSVRPFGLRYAIRPDDGIDLDTADLEFDDELQITLTRHGDQWIPLTDHRLGLTLQTTGTRTTEDEIYDKA